MNPIDHYFINNVLPSGNTQPQRINVDQIIPKVMRFKVSNNKDYPFIKDACVVLKDVSPLLQNYKENPPELQKNIAQRKKTRIEKFLIEKSILNIASEDGGDRYNFRTKRSIKETTKIQAKSNPRKLDLKEKKHSKSLLESTKLSKSNTNNIENSYNFDTQRKLNSEKKIKSTNLNISNKKSSKNIPQILDTGKSKNPNPKNKENVENLDTQEKVNTKKEKKSNPLKTKTKKNCKEINTKNKENCKKINTKNKENSGEINTKNKEKSKKTKTNQEIDNQKVEESIKVSDEPLAQSGREHQQAASQSGAVKPPTVITAKQGTLKYLTQRQNFLREQLSRNDDMDIFESFGRKMPLQDLLQVDKDVSLTIMTPKHKTKEFNGFTPRSALLDEWGKQSGNPASYCTTPQHFAKGEEKQNLHVLFHHLQNNKKRRKGTQKTAAVKEPEIKRNKELPLEIENLSTKCDTSFDDYFNDSL